MHPQELKSDEALILLFRHGETEWNREGRFQGHVDIPLNETGRMQAKRLEKVLRKYKIEAVLSSDLSRAVETAQHALGVDVRIPVFQVPELREAFLGEAQGLTYEEMENRFGVETLERWRSNLPHAHDAKFPGGETGGAVLLRTQTVIAKFLSEHPYRRIGVSSHGGVLRRLVGSLTEGGLVPPVQNGMLYGVTFNLKTRVMTLLGWLAW